MKSLTTTILFLTLFCCITNVQAQADYKYQPSDEHPFGLPNPDAPKEIIDWAPMIGTCDCTSIRRNADGSWGEPEEMTWTFKYIMNGYGVQDETLKKGGIHSGSIRQFNSDSSKWYVHYYSNGAPTPSLTAWEGNMQDTAIILYNEQKAPNGMDGFYKIHFYDMSDEGFEWFGEWINTSETFSYPTWKISCKRKQDAQAQSEKEKILALISEISQAYMDGDHVKMAKAYTTDGKIFPGSSDIISGRAGLEKFWKLSDGVEIMSHKVTPKQITILGDTAYDYGYYEGSSRKNGTVSPFKGKYVIIWKKVDGIWKMYLDIWNRM